MDKHRDRQSGEWWEPLDEHATFQIGIDYGFRSAFTRGAPLSQAEWEAYTSHGPAAYARAPSYEEYLKLYDKYSDVCRTRYGNKLINDSYLGNSG
jgi:hypothetical protein